MFFLDSSIPWQTNFQDPASRVMEYLILLHHHIFWFVVMILVVVLWFIYTCLVYFANYANYFNSTLITIEENSTLFLKYTSSILKKFNLNFFFKIWIKKWLISNKIIHNSLLEIIWTLIPCFILVGIAIPSFFLLYDMDEVLNPSVTVKVIGHQWYWSYEYTDYKFLNFLNPYILFDSFMVPEDELIQKGELRLLEVDNPIVLPLNLNIRLLITAIDVLHSWAVPSLGIKMDAVPGRLNQAQFLTKRPGIFYGQCSEICGLYHGFMPIVVEILPIRDYITWIATKLSN